MGYPPQGSGTAEVSVWGMACTDDLKNSNDAERTHNGLAYTKKKETKLNEALAAVRIKFDLHIQNALGTAYGKLYKNGAPWGTERSNSEENYVTYSEDFAAADLQPDDLIQLYTYTNNGAFSVFCRNLRFYYHKRMTKIDKQTLDTPLNLQTSAISTTNQDP